MEERLACRDDKVQKTMHPLIFTWAKLVEASSSSNRSSNTDDDTNYSSSISRSSSAPRCRLAVWKHPRYCSVTCDLQPYGTHVNQHSAITQQH